MKKTIFSAVLLAVAMSASVSASAAPDVTDSKIVAVYPADTQRIGSEVLVRVETEQSRNSVANTKVYVREDAVPAELLTAKK